MDVVKTARIQIGIILSNFKGMCEADIVIMDALVENRIDHICAGFKVDHRWIPIRIGVNGMQRLIQGRGRIVQVKAQ